MKGIAPIIIGVIFLVAMFIMIIPAAVMKINFVRILEVQFNLNNAQLTLITLLSSTYQEKNIAEIISEKIILDDNDFSIVKERLDKIVESKCYALKTETKELISTASSTCNPSEFQAATVLSLPYSKEKQTEILRLVMN